MPDSVVMIHLGKQRDKATRSPTMVMPIGDTLLHSTGHPAALHKSPWGQGRVQKLGAIIA